MDLRSELLYKHITNVNFHNQLNNVSTRANLYGILGCLYGKELTLEFAKELYKKGFFEVLSNIEPGFAVHEDLNTLDLESLEIEYARLFIGPVPQSPPYASVYREDDRSAGQLWGESTGEVKRFMAHYGLEINESGLIPDHISILFEFMEKLLRRKIDAIKKNDIRASVVAERIQRQFFMDYIEPWIERFLNRAKRVKPLPFYAAVIKYTSHFIAHEKISI